MFKYGFYIFTYTIPFRKNPAIFPYSCTISVQEMLLLGLSKVYGLFTYTFIRYVTVNFHQVSVQINMQFLVPSVFRPLLSDVFNGRHFKRIPLVPFANFAHVRSKLDKKMFSDRTGKFVIFRASFDDTKRHLGIFVLNMGFAFMLGQSCFL